MRAYRFELCNYLVQLGELAAVDVERRRAGVAGRVAGAQALGEAGTPLDLYPTSRTEGGRCCGREFCGSPDQMKFDLISAGSADASHNIRVMKWGTLELEPEVEEWYGKLDDARRARAPDRPAYRLSQDEAPRAGGD